MEKHVTEIAAQTPSGKSAKRLRVVAYCRVSTTSEEQEDSLESQVNYYSLIIRESPEWEFAGVFSDTGSGRNTRKRPAFRQLMELCKKKKVDLILTKSISRFGRNSLVTLKALEKLRLWGIDVWFDLE